MAPFLMAKALVCWLVAGGVVTADPNLRHVSDLDEVCPRCDMIFTMLETASNGERVQHIAAAQRGEPKSGTTFMYHWAHAALIHTCSFLNHWFGGGSCQLKTGRYRGMFHTPEAVSITFEPRSGGDDAKCSCEGVDRVEISVTDDDKHRLPVLRSCEWQHPAGLARHEVGCLSADGHPAENYFDIWLCMEKAACKITDDRHQFVTMRDPRAAVVSTFFHQKKFPVSKKPGSVGGDIHTLDEFVLAVAPILCQWYTLRFLLFSAVLAPKSTLFWYADAFRDAHKWHYEWMAFVGVHLPEPVIDSMAEAALRDDFSFNTMGKNDHPGVTANTKLGATNTTTWQELLRPDTLVELNVVARKWLPPAVLEKIITRDHSK